MEDLNMNEYFLNKKLREPKSKKKIKLSVYMLFLASVIFVCCGVIFISSKNVCSRVVENVPQSGFIRNIDEYCEPSPEFVRIKLNDILLKCQKLLFKNSPHEELYAGMWKSEDEIYEISKRFKPYDPNPLLLKNIADQIDDLLKEIALLKPDKEKMKPKEVQVLSEVRVFLQQFFGHIYDSDFYGGEWMFGPNYFCMNKICSLDYEVQLFKSLFKPRTTEDIEFAMNTFNEYKNTINQYISNLEMGVNAGMVKSKLACSAGADAFKQNYQRIIIQGKTKGTQDTYFEGISDSFYSQLKNETIALWEKVHHESVNVSVERALKSGFDESIIRLYQYLTKNYSRHCPPDDEASGLSKLPLEYVYFDGIKNVNRPTTKMLPHTNKILDGRFLYRRVVPRFTTIDISPEEIFEEGKRQVDLFYPQIVNISLQYTKEADEEKATTEIRNVLEANEQWHGPLKFPENESNKEAFEKCIDDESSKKYCPVRWKSVQSWFDDINSILAMIHSKLYSAFHFTGPMNSSPNCPIRMACHYNPSSGAKSFYRSDSKCSAPTTFVLPFFLEKYGPKFQEWSVAGHEGRPGHQFQFQGSEELFKDLCPKDLSSYIHSKVYFSGFVEGWGLYAENPVLSDDVGLYKDNLLQELGMYKGQIWRALRLLVDTGLHYRGKNRTWALNQFDKFALDNSDFGRKEVTRYMSCPGQATSYMIGRLVILKARRKAEQELGLRFSLKDFHYQILSIGQAPLDYITDHIDRYIKCVKEPTLLYCEYILTPKRSIPKTSDKHVFYKNFLNPPIQYYS